MLTNKESFLALFTNKVTVYGHKASKNHENNLVRSKSLQNQPAPIVISPNKIPNRNDLKKEKNSTLYRHIKKRSKTILDEENLSERDI